MTNNVARRHTTFITLVLSALVLTGVLLAAPGSASAASVYTRTLLYTFPSSFTISVAAADNGDVIVGDFASSPATSGLSRIAQGTRTPIYAYAGGSPQIYDVKVDNQGQFVAAEFGTANGSLAKLSPSGSRSLIYSPASGRTALSVDIDTDGGYIVFVSDYTGSYQALEKIGSDGSVAKTYPLPRNSRGNGRVAIDDDGNYVTTQAGDSPGSSFARLLKVDRASGAVTTVYEFEKSARPFGLAVDPQGNYLVTESGSNILSRITQDGQREVLFQFPAGTAPHGIDIDSAGDYVVAEPGTRTVSKLSSADAPSGFPDVSASDPYYTAITGMAARGIIGGFEDGTFGPDKLVTRQQFAKMIVLTLDLPVAEGDYPNAAVPFQDLGPDDLTKLYPHEYVAVCALNNITKGTDAAHFAPLLNIKRAQMITMVVRAADNLAAGALDSVPPGWDGDLAYGDPTHGANIKKAEYNGLLDGIIDPASTLASWNTTGNATRGEVAQILWNLLQKLE